MAKRENKSSNVLSHIKKVNKLHIKMNPKLGEDIVITVDSTGIKVADKDDEEMKMAKKHRGFPQDSCGCGFKANYGVTITDDKSHDSKHLVLN